MTPPVSIIIANWNGGEVMKSCLIFLEKISYPNWEVIIVDNGSTDNSENAITDFKIGIKKYRIIKNSKNLGFAPANNQGYQKSSGKYLLLLNNDTEVPKDFLDILVKKMEADPSIGVIQPKIKLLDKPGYLDNAGSFFTRIGFLHHWGFLQKDSPEFDKEVEIFSAKGACMLIRRSIVDKIGLFDDRFFSYFEESDFCWRVWLSGYRVVFYPKSYIYHKVGYTIKRLNVLQINYHYYKNRIYSLIKNLNAANLLIVLIPHLIISIGIAGLFIIRMQPKNGLMILKAIGWNIGNLPAIWIARIKTQKYRKVTDNHLFSKLSRPINWIQYAKDFKRVEADLKK